MLRSATVSPVSQPTSKSQTGIAPQVKAVNQQPLPSIRGINTTASQVKALNGQQRPYAAPLPITLINRTAGLERTAGQNYTFAPTSPAATSDQVLILVIMVRLIQPMVIVVQNMMRAVIVKLSTIVARKV